MSLIGSQSSNVTTFPVVIDVTGDPSGLYAGSTATVNIIVKQLNNVTEVPTAAISYSSSGQASVTQVVNGSDVVKPVTVGPAQSGETQIVSGVTAGDKVLERVITFRGGAGGTGGGLFGGTGGRLGGGPEGSVVPEASAVPEGSVVPEGSAAPADSAVLVASAVADEHHD